jgi:PadR family transcriptional regulator, regulatory protein PadR
MAEAERELMRSTVTGFSRAIMLWLLQEKPMSGYAIVKELELLMGQQLSSGIVYPLLYELEKEGYISGVWSQRGKRRIKHYSLTPKGEELLSRLRKLFEMPVREALKEFITEKPNKQ